MKHITIIKIIASIEVIIGAMTLTGTVAYLSLSLSEKPLNVLLFVVVSSLTSFAIGIGLFWFKDLARRTLIFFSGYIILTKLFIFMGLMQLTGEIVTVVPSTLKNLASLSYHAAIIILLRRPAVVKSFTAKKRHA